MRLADYFDKAVRTGTREHALVEGDVRISHLEVQAQVHAIANAMDADADIRPGAHVAIYCPNHWRVPVLLLAINRADRVRLPVHTRNPLAVNLEVLAFMDCEVLFFHSRFEHEVAEMRAALPRLRRVICIDAESAHGPSLAAWSAPHQRPYLSQMEDPMAPAFLQPTGGTTGPSKAAIHTHRSAEMMLIGNRLSGDHDAHHTYLAVAPLTHAGGTAALHTLCAGNTVVVLDDTSPAAILDAIERHGVTHFFLPPTLFYLLLAELERAPRALPSLRQLGVGAAPVSPDKVKQATRMLGPIVAEGYGQTECGAPVTRKVPADYIHADGRFDEVALRSAGKAVDTVWVEIMDDQGRLLPAGERGEIVVRGGSLMLGYYKNEAETARIDAFGWRHTGDVGVKDERGFLTIVDRVKDMIVTGGFNVYPAQVERVILEFDAVQECAVVGVPDDTWGEAVKAVVELKPGQTLDEGEVIALCKARLGGVYAPKSVEVWPSIPRSAVGKTLRREVREAFWRQHWRAV
ncbi:hypothetical protein CCO03_13475 [Comamonas serinivorans]|uniref:Long-chain fatty acid--CoA ligase n=1 Tax=Comamonas serinivorans TaxID=1082851 RepID=A0A1Y0EPJ6_9BURK|nr:AMP-binding protein [Comamonas serinivorans]ARU05557.1 hypothetical protein CCO03_13475 [Comamonas serinivorans]